jgi:transcriptional regulator with XRE-family HTH domain
VETFASRLNFAMERRGISAATISKRLGIAEATVSNYRKGKYIPKQQRTEAIANILRVDIAWLMGADVPMQSKSSPTISAEEEALLELFRSLPLEKQKLALEMIRVALSTEE